VVFRPLGAYWRRRFTDRRKTMQRRTRIAAATAVGVLVLGGAGAGVAVAASGGDDDGTETPISGDDLDRASAAALEHTGGGKVTETEVGDEESLYEVEVTLDDGSQVDVQLDSNFKVVGDERDGAGDEDG
jgi:uncharacterized membrane protein YkoI